MNRKEIGKKIGSLILAAVMLYGCGTAQAEKNGQTGSEITISAQLEEDTSAKPGNGSSSEEPLSGAQSSETPSGNSVKTGKEMPAFTAKDLQGNEVTESIFGGKDLTVVNIWGTFCPPCIGEMPELGEWAKSMPENVQIVGLIIDIEGDEDTEHRDLALEITEKAGAEFMQIIANQDFYPIVRQVVGVPTTLFVDREGYIVGNPIIGADVDGYKRFVEDYLNEQ